MPREPFDNSDIGVGATGLAILEAEKEFGVASDKHPEPPEAYVAIGRVCLRQGYKTPAVRINRPIMRLINITVKSVCD